MAVVACCAAAGSSGVSTTGLLLAALTPGAEPVLFVETDPSGGDVAAWMGSGDRPGLATLVTEPDRSSTGLSAHVQRLPSGLAVLVAPARAQQAAVAVREVVPWLAPILVAERRVLSVCDAGRVDPVALPAVVTHADLAVVVLRQSPDSGPGTVARVDRTGELVERLAWAGVAHALAVVGVGPYRADELAAHVAADLLGVLPEDARGASAASGGWTLGRAAGRSVLAGAGRHLAVSVMGRVAAQGAVTR